MALPRLGYYVGHDDGKTNKPAPPPLRRGDPSESSVGLKEDVAREHERNESLVAPYKYVDQHELEKFCEGEMMHHITFLSKLKRIRPDAFYNDFSRMGRIGINVLVDGVATYTGTTVQQGISPEFSQIRTDAHGLGKEEKYRGWRTTLTHLMKRGFVSEAKVNRVFGIPTHARGNRYNKYRWELRNFGA